MSPVTILVVEDEAILRMDFSEYLSDQGYVVLEAANADQAIAHLERNESIRLVFTDIDMPGSMDGLKLASAVSERWPPVKIIVASGHTGVGESDLPVGSIFFAKPYSQGSVANVMRQLLA